MTKNPYTPLDAANTPRYSGLGQRDRGDTVAMAALTGLFGVVVGYTLCAAAGLAIEARVLPHFTIRDLPLFPYGKTFGLAISPLAGVLCACIGVAIVCRRLWGRLLSAGVCTTISATIAILVFRMWRNDLTHFGNRPEYLALYLPLGIACTITLVIGSSCCGLSIVRNITCDKSKHDRGGPGTKEK